MSDRDAFLAAIHATPDDDAPRLVYSDWLEEQGQTERAEFIRIQLEMRREHDAHGRVTPRLDALFLKQKELFKRPWADVLRRCGAATVSTYSRGFSASGFFLSAAAFVREAMDLAGWFGPQTRMTLTNSRGNLGRVAECRDLRWLYVLTLVREWRQPDYTDEDLDALFASPFLDSIRRLHFPGRPGPLNGDSREGLSAVACRSLAEAASLTRLEELNLSDNPIGNDGAVILAEARTLSRLRILALQRAELTTRGAERLLNSTALSSLEQLDLTGNRLSERMRDRLRDRFGDRVKLGAS